MFLTCSILFLCICMWSQMVRMVFPYHQAIRHKASIFLASFKYSRFSSLILHLPSRAVGSHPQLPLPKPMVTLLLTFPASNLSKSKLLSVMVQLDGRSPYTDCIPKWIHFLQHKPLTHDLTSAYLLMWPHWKQTMNLYGILVKFPQS